MVLRPRAGRGAGSRDQSPGHRPKGRRRRRLGSRAGEHSAVHAANVDFNPTGVALITSQCRKNGRKASMAALIASDCGQIRR